MEFAEFGLASLVIIIVMAAMSGGLILYGYHLNRRESHAQIQAFQPLSSSAQEGLFNTHLGSAQDTEQSSNKPKAKMGKSKPRTQPAKAKLQKSSDSAKLGPKDAKPLPQPKRVNVSRATTTTKDGMTEQTIFDAVDPDGKLPAEGIIKHVVRKKAEPAVMVGSHKGSDRFKETTSLQKPADSAAEDDKKELVTKNTEATMEASKLKSTKPRVVTPVVSKNAPVQPQGADSISKRGPVSVAKPSNLVAIRTPPKPAVGTDQQRVKLKLANDDVTGEPSAVTSPKQVVDSADDYVILTVMGEQDSSFVIAKLAEYLLKRGLTYDKLGLFCKTDTQTGRVLFKVADAYAPGNFNLDPVEAHTTQGVTFVMWLSKVINPQSTFELMLGLATDCAASYNAIVQDENCNKLSKQTISHYRNRIADYRRKQMTM